MYDIIFNPVSAKGKSRAALNVVEGVLHSKSIPYTVHETQYQGHAKELAAALSAQPVNLIVMGGDGTFSEVLNGIENFQNVVLGLIPCGTGNDFVRATTIPSDVQGALDIILRGDKGYVDFIQLGDRRALNCAGAGMDVDTLVRYETIKFFKGKLRYYAALIDVLLHTKFHKLRLTVDGVTQEKSVFLITAANGTCIGGGMPISPNSDPFDGKFDIVVVNEIKKRKILPLLIKFLNGGKHINAPCTEVYRTDHAVIEILDDGKTEVDGEVFDGKVLDCRIVTDTLTIFR